MIVKQGQWSRTFAWIPTRILERVAKGEYRVRTVFLKPMYCTLIGGNGGAASISYKAEDTYAHEWFESVMAKVNTALTLEEKKAFLSQNKISYRTHSITEAHDAVELIAAEFTVN